jgi:hypothetical protein
MRAFFGVNRSSRESAMMADDPEYQNHAVFAQLDGQIAFYEHLAESVFLWVSSGTGAFTNIDSYLYSSIQGTLPSIRSVLRDGQLNDAYALLRKYYDSVVINIYSILYLDDHVSIDNFIVEQIENWLKGRSRLPGLKEMITYIRSSTAAAPVTAALNVDDRYLRIRERSNDHTHYNFYSHALLNDGRLHLSGRRRVLDQFAADVRDVFVFHLAYLFFARQHYMASSDYVDYLECGMTPPPDSQYWVAPFVQEAFDQFLSQHRPDVAAIVKAQTCMHLA